MKKLILIIFSTLSLNAESQVKDTLHNQFRDYVEWIKKKEQKPQIPKEPVKKDTLVLYNQFRDYVEWTKKNERSSN